MVINTNLPAFSALNALNKTNNLMSKSIERLSSGLRINSAADDAAGFAISEKLRAQTRGINTAIRNSQDGISLLQTAEGALSSISSIIDRMRELAVQAANDTLTSEDRSDIQLELDELKKNINDIANTTQFNKKRLLDGSSCALWSSSDLNLKAVVNGAIKVSAAGNYKIEINAQAGAAQVQKSNIFKVNKTTQEQDIRTETVRNLNLNTDTASITSDSNYYIDISTTGEANGKIDASDWDVANAQNLTELKSGWSFDTSTNTLSITASGNYVINGDASKATQNRIKVASGVTANIMLRNVNINLNSQPQACALLVEAGAKANIYLSGNNTLVSGSKRAGIELPDEATLVLSSAAGDFQETGSLTVTGGAQAAGIGGSGNANSNYKAGTMTFMGGTINVNGGHDAAGIGGGYNSGDNGGGTINIYGGNITAISPLDAGIGTGLKGGAAKDLNGGTVINITGGTVYAQGGTGVGAGIGGGQGFNSGVINIKSGLYNVDNTGAVKAIAGGNSAAAVGHGGGGTDDGVNLNASIDAPTAGNLPTWPVAQSPITTSNFTVTLTESTREVELTPPSFENKLLNIELSRISGAANVSAKGLPSGSYTVSTSSTPVSNSTAELTGSYGFNSSLEDLLTVKTKTSANDFSLEDLAANASILFEVVSVGSDSVTLKATANLLNPDGSSEARLVRENIVLKEGVACGLTGLKLRGSDSDIDALTEYKHPAAELTLKSGAASSFKAGNKFVYNFTAGAVSNQTVKINSTQSSSWSGNIADSEIKFGINADKVKNQELHFSNFYLDSSSGNVYQGDIIITANDNAIKGGTKLASFDTSWTEPENITAVEAAGLNSQLVEIDKFYNAQGVFILDKPQTLTISQGGKRANIVLYAHDTIGDIIFKLNNAIANDLGQGTYVDKSNKFVTFVERGAKADNTSESVEGTLLVRSAIAGKAGELSFSSISEDLLRALGLNTIQAASESTYSVSIRDAHTGSTVASSVKVTGNKISGLIHKNLDLEFDYKAGIKASWNEADRKYILQADNNSYTETLHLADRGITFQTGANEGEDMFISIGDASCDALGIADINVADRESAVRSLHTLDLAYKKVISQRAKIGAYENSLETITSIITEAAANLTQAESRIRDTNTAKEMMELVKLQILNQSGTSMLVQANQLPQEMLNLITI